jgi:hypothetical protein
LKKIIVIALFAIALSPHAAFAQDAELSGTWRLTFATTPELQITMSFLEITIFFVGTSGPPDDCTWFGADLPLIGNSSLVTGLMTCGLPTPTVNAFLFATATNNSMTGFVISPNLTPPVAAFEGEKARSVEGSLSRR